MLRFRSIAVTNLHRQAKFISLIRLILPMVVLSFTPVSPSSAIIRRMTNDKRTVSRGHGCGYWLLTLLTATLAVVALGMAVRAVTLPPELWRRSVLCCLWSWAAGIMGRRVRVGDVAADSWQTRGGEDWRWG